MQDQTEQPAIRPDINMDELIIRINEMDAVFTRFNNQRSLVMDCRIKAKQFGDATALIDSNRPDSTYYNRVIGFTDKALHLLDNILKWYNENQSACIFSLAPTQQTEKVLDAFKIKELCYNGHDCIFHAIPRESSLTLPEHISIEQVTQDTLNDLFRLMETNNWPIKEAFCHQNRDFYTRPDFRFYLARVNGQVAAMGSIFIYKDMAWLSNDATADEFRRNGCQQLLIDHRLDVALRNGVDHVITDTEFGVTSHRNMLKNGFQLAYMTAEFIKQRPERKG